MRAPVRHTYLLAGFLALLIGLDIAKLWVGPETVPEIPKAPQVDFNDLERLRLAQGEEVVELRRTQDDWRVIIPYEAEADADAANGIRRLLEKGLELELQIEENSKDLKSFGLDPGFLMEAYTDAEQPVVALYLGKNTTGGATFVRFPDDKSVYRAQIGGRERYTKLPPAWRNPVVSRFVPSNAKTVRLDTQKHSLHFERQTDQSDWVLLQDPQFPIDQREVQMLVEALSGLRAGAVLSSAHPAGLEAPVVEVTIEMNQGKPIALSFGRTLAGAFAKNYAKEDIYQIAPSFTERLSRPKAAWYNQLLFSFERTKLLRMSMTEQGTGTTLLEQDPATNRWTVLKPANVDANLRESMQAAIALSELRAVAMATVLPNEAGFPSPNYITIEMLDGTKQKLELGRQVPGMPKGQEALFVRTNELPDRIALLPIRTIMKIRRAFSR